MIGFIEDKEAVQKILKHLALWIVKEKPPPKANPPPIDAHLEYSACPGATRLPIVDLDYALFQT